MKTSTCAVLATLGLLASPLALADSPTCVAPEQLVSWPAGNPVWEFCYTAYGQSSGPRGSGLDLRNIHYNGRLVLKQAHAPMLFAEYTTNTCYRDWKDVSTPILAEPAVRNQVGTSSVFNATTSCDRSNDPVASYGVCPYALPGRVPGDCFTGVALENKGDHLLVTAQYVADWYMYSSRFAFYQDGSFEPEFGFGNRNGTNNSITHWHHNYWRLDFDIEGGTNDLIAQDGVVQSSEFATLRCNPVTTPSCANERRWTVVDSVTGRGYELVPSSDDYVTPTNQSGRAFHLVDVMGTVYTVGEYGDNPAYSLGDCSMDEENLANGGDLDGPAGTGADVVLWYRVGVRDQTGVDSMICKRAGPAFRPIGNWNQPPLFADGFE
jgi:hypothetical protein